MRVLGFDPGAHTGWCLLDCGASRPRYLASGTIEVGHAVEVAGRKPGTVRQVRRVSDEDIARLIRETRSILTEHHCQTVAISRIHEVHPTGRHEARTGQATGTAIATGLVLASGVAWLLYALAYDSGKVVVTVREAEWRKALGCESPRGVSADVWIGRIIPARIDGWPSARTDGITAHVRDAAGAAEFVGYRATQGGRSWPNPSMKPPRSAPGDL